MRVTFIKKQKKPELSNSGCILKQKIYQIDSLSFPVTVFFNLMMKI